MSKEAMKLALEALESCDAAHITDGGHQWYDEKLVDTAYAALREALAEQPAQHQELVGDMREWCAQLCEWLPVGTGFEGRTFAEAIRGVGKYGAMAKAFEGWQPAQSTWVGLTDEEARKLIKVGPVYAPDGVVTRSPIAYRKELEEAGLRGLRKGEAAHGIKENT